MFDHSSEEVKKEGKFKRFLLSSWTPVPSWTKTIAILLICGILLIIFGIILCIIDSAIVEVKVRYDNQCSIGDECTVKVTIPEEMKAPVFVYYELTNFYQSHRRYLTSKSSSQLKGEEISLGDAESSCSPMVKNKDLGQTKAYKSGIDLDPEAVAIPCGLGAVTMFRDTFSLLTPGNAAITINEKDITWDGEIGNKFKNFDLTKQWMDMEIGRAHV